MSDVTKDQLCLDIKECQEIELCLMKRIHDYCERHGLRYNLAFGTLLGAVRHHGFIPWDNDMDILMPRPDYERLLSLVADDPIGEHAYLLHWSTDDSYHYPIVRICDDRTVVAPGYVREQPERMGVWVDIFPVDGVWENPWAHVPSRVEMRALKVLQRADNYSPGSSTGIKRVLKAVVSRFFPNRDNAFQRKIDEVAMRCPFGSTTFADTVTEYEETYPRLTVDNFDHPVMLEFEGVEFRCPANWDEILTWTYGSYLQLPPENERMTHDVHACWLNDEARQMFAAELGGAHED